MYGASTPADACVAPMPIGRSSTISTDAPRRASSAATAQPTIPAPTTMMSEGRDICVRLGILQRSVRTKQPALRLTANFPPSGGLMRTIVRVCGMTVCALALTVAAASAHNPRWTDDDLARFASAIVSGRVIDIAVGRDIATGAVHTYVTVSVDRVFKGDVPERQIVVKQLGGVWGTDHFVVFDQAEFSPGEDVLLYLEVRPRDRTLYTSALWQGKWTLERDAATGEAIATRREPDGMRGVLRGEPERRSLAALKARLSALGARSSPSSGARSFVTEPPAEEMNATVHMRSDVLPFTFLGPYRWNEFDTRAAIPVDTQSGGQPGLAGGGGAELGRAAGAWLNAT